MNVFRNNRSFSLAAALSLLLSSVAMQRAKAADQAAAIPQFPAAEPMIATMLPAGMSRGSTVHVTLDGTNLTAVETVRISGEGIIAEIIPAPEGKPVNGRQLAVKLIASADAELGRRELRVVTASGVSNVVRFVVGTLPEALEVEPNDTAATAMKIDQLPIVMNGAISRAEDRDQFRFDAKAGQQIVFDLIGQRLHPYVGNQRPGWFEGFLAIREVTELGAAADLLKAAEQDAAEKKKVAQREAARKPSEKQAEIQKQALKKANDELAAANTLFAERKSVVAKLMDQRVRHLAFSHEFGGREDPLLVFTVPRDGQYVVEVRDDLYRGRAEYSYRLTIGEIPFVTSVFPLGGQRGTTLPLTLEGFNLKNDTKRSVTVAADADSQRLGLQKLTANTIESNDCELEFSSDPEAIEAEPNDTASEATVTAFPAVLNGVIERNGDVDFFRFNAAKGERLYFDVTARSLGSPLDAKLDLFDAQGKRLKEIDDVTNLADAMLDHTFSADGEYLIRVSDATESGSRRHAYRLKIRAPRPDFSLTVSPDNPRVTAGGSIALKVIAQRRDGFAGDITISLGKEIAGVTASPAMLGSGQTETLVTLTAAADVQTMVAPLTVVGRATINEQEIARPATSMEQFRINNNWRYVPVGDVVLSVLPPAPVTVAWDQAEVKVVAGETVQIPVTITRAAGFTAPVRIVIEGMPQRVSSPPVTIAEGATTGTVEIRTINSVPASVANLVATGAVTADGKTFTQHSPALKLQIEPAPKK